MTNTLCHVSIVIIKKRTTNLERQKVWKKNLKQIYKKRNYKYIKKKLQSYNLE